MIVGRLTVSFDRGIARNTPHDLRLSDEPPEETPMGGIVRGIGTHYRSAAARDQALAWAAEGRRVRQAFIRAFVVSPIPGVYVMPDRHAGTRLLQELDYDPRITVRCAVYDLAPRDRNVEEVREWGQRMRDQLQSAPLGRGKELDDDGLKVLERLTACPVFTPATANRLRELIAGARLEKMDRPEFKRRLASLRIDVDLGTVAAPRRARLTPTRSQEPAPDADDAGPGDTAAA